MIMMLLDYFKILQNATLIVLVNDYVNVMFAN